jgi:endo-1,4-beta-mannosidase
MESELRANRKSLHRVRQLLSLAEHVGLYLDITGLGCYHKADVPAWYDALSEKHRWEVQARFWKAVANECKRSPAIFCYDLMNEPVASAGDGKGTEWLGPAFAGKHFVQRISREQRSRERHAIAREWTRRLVSAIREVDSRHLITVGLVDWSLDRPGLTSGFVPKHIASEIDFVSVHLYPEQANVNEAIATLRGFAIGKPVVIEETFPLKCSREEFADFIHRSRDVAAGWIGFYWGKTPEQCRGSKDFSDALMLGWLEFFQEQVRRK